MNGKHLLFSLALLSQGLVAQETQEYKELFHVDEGAILDINTTHTDIEFETWKKDQVEVVATITLEGATEEEQRAFFEKDAFVIVGNSSKISVTSKTPRYWVGAFGDSDMDIHFDLEPLLLDLEIPDLPELAVIPELPPLPPLPFKNFDYEEYERNGDDYLEEWTERFTQDFEHAYGDRIEEWGKRVGERAKEWEERNADRIERRKELLEERAEEMNARMEERDMERAKMRKEREEALERRVESKVVIKKDGKKKVYIQEGDGADVLYFSKGGNSKKYKVRKTLKIRMPKSIKLRMDVKHGEVKLAANLKNIEASLRHASLLASSIGGEQTAIQATYTPMVVQKWSHGQLKAAHSDPIRLKKVGELRLNSVSSTVVMDTLFKKAYITNSLGKVVIEGIDQGFSDIDVSMENGEVVCTLPKQPVALYLNGTKSTFNYPSAVVLEETENFDNTILDGYWKKKGSNKSIRITSKYSNVHLKE